MKYHPTKIAACALAVLVSGATAHASYSNSVVSLKPVAYWPLTETNQPPSSQAANLGSTGSTNNAFYIPGVTQGIPGAIAASSDTAASFNGSRGFVDLPFNPSLTINAPFTAEGWMNSGNNGATFCAMACGDFGGTRSGWLIYNNGGAWNFRLYNQNGGTPSFNKQGGNATVGTWHHVVGEYDGTNASLYVDGVLIAGPTAAAFVPNDNGGLTIGGRSDGGFLFNGSVDEVAIYSNALDAGTILAHYQNGTNTSPAQTYNSLILAANPTFYYRLDEPAVVSTVTATNYGSFGAAVNGIYQAGTYPGSLGPTNIGLPSPALACQFVPVGTSGAGGVVDCGADPRLNITNAMSVVAWFKGGPADNRFQSFLGKSDNAWRADMDPNNAHWADGGGNGDAVGGSAVNDGNWHFFAGVYDGGHNYIYVDGALDATPVTATPGFTGDSANHVVLGGVGDYATRNFLGSIAQVAVFTNALSAGQVSMLYDDSISLAPIIAQNPQNLAMNNGGTGSFTVLSSGQPLSYYWYNGTTLVGNVPGNISGANTATLSFTNAVPSNNGSYSVIVSNSYGTATSQVATLTVYNNVVITSDITPSNVVLYSGGHATFSIQAGGTQPISYQWYSNTVAQAGATNTSFTLLNASAATTVYCVATNATSSATSSSASVSIIFPDNSYASTIVAANPVGFWRLTETNNPSLTFNAGVTTFDFWGGNNGTYTNTTLGNPSYNPNDTNDTSAGFGFSSSFTDNDSYNIPVDFSAPSNSSSAFSIEAWARGTTGPQSTDSGLVSKGYGGGGEQFNLDCGASTNHSFRFFVRDAGGATHGVGSSVSPADNAWHHLAAVCDEPNGTVYLYVDGLLAGTNSIAPGSGILSSTRSMIIGSRPSGISGGNDNQFIGSMADVSVYNYALSQSQVINHYYSAQIPAHIGVQPTDVTAGQFGTASFSAVVVGSPVVGEQWYNAGTALPISGATNSTLVLSGVTSAQNATQYYLVVTNAYGTNQSSTVTLTVISGAPQITTDVQSPFFAVTGGSGSDSAGGYGDEPLSYQWQFNGTNLSDVGGISGSHSNVITIANAQPSEAGNYRLIVSNGAGSATSSPALFIVGSSPIAFNVNGGGWQANGNALIATNLLTLTEGFNSETSSFFYDYPQYVGAFRASFTYQDVGGGGADGTTFCIQNDPRGTTALGGGGGLLGVGGPPNTVTPSAQLEINIYNGHIVGYTVQSGGITGGDGATYTTPGSVNVASGNPIDVVVNYAHGNIGLSFTERTNVNNVFTTNVVMDIPAAVGGTSAYVGFTAATGGVASTQTVTNFSFVSIPPTGIRASGGNAIISWPSEVLGFTLQQSTNLSVSNWSTVTNADVIANGLHNVTVPASGKAAFYRLFLP